MKYYKAMSLIEIIVVIGLFSVVMVSGVVVVIQSFNLNRDSTERNKARILAVEGIEAVKSIKRVDWANISPGQYGLDDSLGYWSLTGNTENVGKFERVVFVSEVYRDNLGNITDDEINGFLDESALKITVEVNWNYKGTINKSVEMSSYITQWDQEIALLGSGMIIYAYTNNVGEGIKYRKFLPGDRWGPEMILTDYTVDSGYDIRRLELYSSLNSSTKILLTKQSGSTQKLYANVFRDNAWEQKVLLGEFSNPLYPVSRDFDGGFMANGNFILVYNDNTTSPKYRVWNKTNWSDPLPVANLGSIPVWISSVNMDNSDEYMFGFRNVNLHTMTAYWNGGNNTFGGITTHATAATIIETENVDFAYDLVGRQGGLMYSDKENDNNPNLRIFSYPNNWGNSVDNINVGGRVNSFRLTVNPVNPQFLGCTQDSNNTINCMASGFQPQWTSPKIRIASNNYPSTNISFDLSYEMRTGTEAIAVYSQGQNDRHIPKYRIYDVANDAWSSEYTMPAIGPGDGNNELFSVRAIPRYETNEVMFLLGGESGRFATDVWNGDVNSFYASGAKGFNLHSTEGPSGSFYWFDFEWIY